ncbi:segregation and condensation protein B [Kitasatospora sp. MAA19]|nr:segregation and condensation protein B [Kitasatospora sp. MAA19]
MSGGSGSGGGGGGGGGWSGGGWSEGGGRPVRRPLGLPGRPRVEEWLEPAFELLPEPIAEPVPVAVPVVEPAGAPEVAPVPPVALVEPVEPVPASGEGEARVGHQKSAPSTSGATDPVEDEGPAEAGLKAELEAILMVVDEPAGEERLAGVLERPRAQVAVALRELSAEYTAQGRGFDLRLVAGGWRFYSRDTCAPAVDRFLLDGQQARLTQAALETLAVVAYRQPVSRSRVSAVRGVNCDGVMRTLVQRGLVEEAGSEPETGAILYRTTNYFLERMGLRGLDELPELAPFLPEVDDVEAESLEGTMIAEAVAAAAVQVVDGSGEAGRAAPDR